MFRKILKWVLYGFLTILTLLLVYFVKAYISVNNRAEKVYAIDFKPFEFHSDSSVIAEGGRLVKAHGCYDCHGKDLGGSVWLDDKLLGRVVAPNLTRGKGGIPSNYSVDDFLLAFKHGLNQEYKPLRIMPSHEFTLLNEEDLNAIVMYCDQLEPIDRKLPDTKFGFLGYILGDLNKIKLFPAEEIDHLRPLIKSIKHEVSIEFGKYLTQGCTGCHREDFKGGEPIAPGFPPVANIATSGNPGKWSEAQFINTLRTGITPEGKKLNPAEMPWTSTQHFTDIELKAIYKYLQSLK